MGIEPFVEALNQGARVIVAGRAYDPAVFAALAVKEGYDKGLAIHMGKILECACIAATPGSGSDCMMGYLRRDCFQVEPLNPIRKCTELSVAAHTLYEKSNPYVLPGPGGELNLYNTEFKQVSAKLLSKGQRVCSFKELHDQAGGCEAYGLQDSIHSRSKRPGDD